MNCSLPLRSWLFSLLGICLLLSLCLWLFTNPDTEHRVPLIPEIETIRQADPNTGRSNFVPGGIALSPNQGATLVPSARVLGVDIVASADPLPDNSLKVRSRILAVDPDLDLRAPAIGNESDAVRDLVFDLFDDVQLVGRVARMERHSEERVVYSGPLTNVAGGDFILAYNEGYIAATFTTPGRGFFQIRPHSNGAVIVYELDLTRLPPCEAQYPQSGLTTRNDGVAENFFAELRAKSAIHRQLAANPAPVEGGIYGGQGQQGGDGSHLNFTVIDVLIVYTENAVTAAGGASAMATITDMTFARANSAFINSDIGLRLRMVRSEVVAYAEVNRNTSLTALSEDSGAFVNVSSWRDASGADLVALIFDGGGGLAYIHNGHPNSGFSVNGLNGLEATFIHEIGHNLGCLHDRETRIRDNEQPNPPEPYPYAVGWRFTPENSVELRTIMAYDPGSQIPYFSNPDITYMGTPTGVPIDDELESHNAEVIRQTKASVAAYRSENGNIPPAVSLTSPLREAPLAALDAVILSAEAEDADGSVAEVFFYRLKSDANFGFSNRDSFVVDSATDAPYFGLESAVPAGFWTYAAVAVDNEGAIGVDTVSVTVAPHYRRTNYPLPAGKSRVNLEGINEAGRFVGFGHNGNISATDTQAAYWEGGEIFLLDPLPGDTGARALAVAQDGRIFGKSISDGDVRRAVMWEHSSSPTDISGLIDDFTADAAIGVDELGRIYLSSGINYRRYNNPGSTTTGLNERWHKVANTGTFAAGIDYIFDDVNAFHAMRWNDGGTLLPPLDGYVSAWGRATNRSGAVFGFSSPDGGWNTTTNRLTFWPAGSTTPVDLGTLGAAGGDAGGLNDWNHAVGSANDPDDGSRAVIWKGEGALLVLADVLLPQSGLKRNARLINNRGQIAGTGFEGSNLFIFFLDPLPGLDHRYWLANHFAPAELDDPALVDDQATPAGDGLPNLLKRAFGLDPRVPASVAELAKLPIGTIGEDGHFHFSYVRQRPPRDISYQPEVSLTLANESWHTHLLEQLDVVTLNNDFETVHMRTTFPLSIEERAFVRVRLGR